MVLEVLETVTHALYQFQESILKCDCCPCRRKPNMPSKMKISGVNRDIRKSSQISTNSDELQDVREKKKILTKAYLASGCNASDTAFVHSCSLGVSLKKKASLLRSSS